MGNYVRVGQAGSKWQVMLVVGVQSFPVGPSRELKGDAEWYADRLREALTNLIMQSGPIAG